MKVRRTLTQLEHKVFKRLHPHQHLPNKSGRLRSPLQHPAHGRTDPRTEKRKLHNTLLAMASNPIGMASNLETMASNLEAMASTLIAMASTL